MIYQLRRRDGSPDPRSSGTLTRRDGQVTPLDSFAFTLAPTGTTFRSPTSGATYPIGWRLDVPGEGIRLTVSTPLAGQELDFSRATGVAYWEGVIDVAGTGRDGRALSGRGYLEMTGYAGSMGRFLSTPR
jgi:predicted secreted hydrolase